MLRVKGHKYTCPVCQNSFDGPAKPLSTSVIKRRTDLKPITTHGQSNGGIIFCSGCGYAGFHTDFFYVTPRVARKVRSYLTTRIEKVIDESDKYAHAAKCAQWLEKPDYTVGELWLSASWYAPQRSKKIQKCRARAVKFFERAFIKARIPSEKRAMFCYLTGELYRRLNQRRASNMWFSRVREETISGAGTKYVLLAQQQMSSPREYIVSE